MRQCRYTYKSSRGILLLEVLLAIAFFAIVVLVSTQASLVNIRASETYAAKDTAFRLAREQVEAVRTTADGNWYTLYNTPRDVALFATSTDGVWHIEVGSTTKQIGPETFSISFFVASTSRDRITYDIEDVYTETDRDPSTLKVTAQAVAESGVIAVMTEYVTRWRNKICTQTVWRNSANETVHTHCPTADYAATETYPSGTVETSGGMLQLAP